MSAADIEAGAADGFVLEEERFGGTGADEPAVVAGHGAECEDGAGAGVEEGIGDAVVFGEDLGGLVEGVAFADGAGVGDHACGFGDGGEFFGVEVEEVEAAAAAGVGEFFWGGFAGEAVGPAEDGVERADGHVEGTAGLFPDFFAVGEDIHGGLAEIDDAAGFAAVEASEIAVGDEAAEFLFETVGVVEDGVGGAGGFGGVGVDEREFEAGGHGFVTEAMEGGRGHFWTGVGGHAGWAVYWSQRGLRTNMVRPVEGVRETGMRAKLEDRVSGLPEAARALSRVASAWPLRRRTEGRSVSSVPPCHW